MKIPRKIVFFGSVMLTICCEMVLAQSDGPPAGGGAPRPIAEKTVDTLSQEPLYWSVKSFPSLKQAQNSAGDFSLAAESDGKAWLFTLGPKAQSAKDVAVAIEAGPTTPLKPPDFCFALARALRPQDGSLLCALIPGRKRSTS